MSAKNHPEMVTVPINHSEVHVLLDAIEMVERVLAAIDPKAADVYRQETDALHTRLVLITDDLCPHSTAVVRDADLPLHQSGTLPTTCGTCDGQGCWDCTDSAT